MQLGFKPVFPRDHASALDTAGRFHSVSAPPSGYPMKKLSLCALIAGALFVVVGLVKLAHAAPQPRPLTLFFPLMWDFAMVAIGSGCLFHGECARRAAIVWSLFCVLASFAVGALALEWLLAQPESPMSIHRLIFMSLTTGFGFSYAVWQLLALRRRPAAARWSGPAASATAHHHS